MADFKKIIETEKKEEERKQREAYLNSSEYRRDRDRLEAVSKGSDIETFAGKVIKEFSNHINAILEDNGHSSKYGHCSQAYTLYEKRTKKFLLMFPFESKGPEIMDITIGKGGGNQVSSGLFSSSNALLINGHDLSPRCAASEEWLQQVLAKCFAKLKPAEHSYYGLDWIKVSEIRKSCELKHK